MLVSHLNAIENVLLTQSDVARNSGHPNLRGGPREWFVKSFLENHLPGTLQLGQGEIIDKDSEPNPPKNRYRNQVDIVLYRRDFPRIVYAEWNHAFMVEGVMATIEVKSHLTKKDMKQACEAALAHKNLKRPKPVWTAGNQPENIFSYVVAFGGPKKLSTVATWCRGLCSQLRASPEQLIDMVVVLGKGVVWQSKVFAPIKELELRLSARWGFLPQSEKNLFMLFLHFLTWTSYVSVPPSCVPYGEKVAFSKIGLIL